MKTSTKIKTVRDLLGLLGEQMDTMRPYNKPSPDNIKASGKTASLANTYLSTVKLALKVQELRGEKPDPSLLGFAKQKPAQTIQ